MNAAALDFMSASLTSRLRPFDFALRLLFNKGDAPTPEALRAGATVALVRYPVSGCVLHGRSWVPSPTPELGVQSAGSAFEARRCAEDFLHRPLDIRRQTGVRQLLIERGDTGQTELITRMHHATGDGLSLALWLGAQLGEERDISVEPLRLKVCPTKALGIKTPSSYNGPALPLRSTRSAPRSARRRWRTLVLPSGPVKAALGQRRLGCTLNDLLCAVLLTTASAWNGSTRVALWHSINIRERPFEGFGNGSSRVRLYHRFQGCRGWLERATVMRTQMRWCREHGEWNVPDEMSLMSRGPRWLAHAVLHAYAKRPRVDMASLLFAHIERTAPTGQAAFLQRVQEIELVGQLHRAHPLVVTAVGFRDTTRLTLTWDDALFDDADIGRFEALLRGHQEEAFREMLA